MPICGVNNGATFEHWKKIFLGFPEICLHEETVLERSSGGFKHKL